MNGPTSISDLRGPVRVCGEFVQRAKTLNILDGKRYRAGFQRLFVWTP
jgi:hypothetical protein